MFRKIINLIVLTVGLLGLSAKAGDVFFDFNTDPAGTLQVYRNAKWSPTGGNGADPTADGYLSITDAANGQSGAIIFDDADNGLLVAGFTFDCDLRTGGGTGRPADGYSINFARAGDPVLTSGNAQGFAGSPNGNETNLPEEGTQTGISVCLDEWDSGALDVVGITVRVDGKIVFNKPYPTLNGDLGDLSSLQTGPFNQPLDGDANVPGLGWAKLHIEVTPSGKLNVSYKGEAILADFDSGFFPSAGSIVLAGRTGGANSHHHVDNIHLVTVGSNIALISQAKAEGCGVKVTLDDSGGSVVNPASIRIKLDGTLLPPASYVISKNGVTTLVKVSTLPTTLAAGSVHQIQVDATDNSNQPLTRSVSSTVGAYGLVPDGAAVAGIDPNTATGGFVARIHQQTAQRGPGDPNSTVNAEKQLADGFIDLGTGEPVLNVADLSAVDESPDRFYRDVINWNQDAPAAVGNFADDLSIPGIPGGGGTDSIVGSMRAFLKLDAGCYRFGVNSDDGFKVSFGYGKGDVFGVKAGEFNGGRGASDTTFDVVIPVSGMYPVRVDWWEGTGGANVEFFSVNTDTGEKILVNDPVNPGAIKAFRSGSGPAYADSILPVVGEGAAPGSKPIVVKIYDDGANVVGPITFTLDGAPVVAPRLEITKEGEVTTVSVAAPAGGFDPGSSHTGTVTFGGRAHDFNFTVSYLGAGLFVIEMEDFNYDSGASNPMVGVADMDVNVMPYLGGAYAGLGATLDVDYHNADGNDSDVYRAGETPNVNMNSNLGAQANRGEWNMTFSTKIGWVGVGDWGTYTRDIPNSAYKVIAALSFDGRSPGQLHGRLSEVTAGVDTASQTLSPLGTFDAPGSGGWGNNNLLVMKDIDGNDAIIRLSGIKSFRFNMDSGDADWWALVPLPGVVLHPIVVSATPADGSTAPRNEPVHIVIKNQDTKVKPVGGVKLIVDGVNVTAQTVVTVNEPLVDVRWTPTPQYAEGTSHNYVLEFTDTSVPAQVQTRAATWTVNQFGQGDFLIEAEDFNYDGGQANPKAGIAGQDVNVMPYYGGAYADLGALQDIDVRSNNDNASDVYRHGENPNVNMNDNLGQSSARSGWNMTFNMKIGWVGGDQWQNYTRTVPNLVYKVYAALSFDGRAAGQLAGGLERVESDPTQLGQTTTVLGTFNAPGSGGWGRNNYVEMKDASGNTALVRISGATTLRFTHGSGDFDHFILVPSGVDKLRPNVVSVSPGIGATATRNVTMHFIVGNRDTKVKAGTVKLIVNGSDVSAASVINVTAAGATVDYKPAAQFAASSTINYSLIYGDDDTPSVNTTFAGNFLTSVFGNGDFDIEAEDFDYDGGQSNPKAGLAGLDVNVMPYFGNAYDGLGALQGIDVQSDDGNDSDVYRKNENPNVNMNDNLGQDRSRSGWDMTTSYKIGWAGGGQWQNYTRSIPAGAYEVYAALSFDGRAAGQLDAKLEQVTGGLGTAAQTLSPLGTFKAPGSGGWGLNNRIPMKNGSADNAVVNVSAGATTLRLSNYSGDFDYFILVPHAAAGPRFTSITRIPPAPGFPLGGVTLTWEGGCELQVSDNVTGPWVTVTGATSPLSAGIDRAKRFARIHCP